MRVMPSRPKESAKPAPPQEWSHSWNRRTCTQGSLWQATIWEGQYLPLQKIHWPLWVWEWRSWWRVPQFNCKYPCQGSQILPTPCRGANHPNCTRTDRGTGPHLGGGVYPVCKPDGPGCTGEPVCWHGDMSTKCNEYGAHPHGDG